MSSTRPRRIVRRAVVAVAVVVLLLGIGAAWFATREPPELERSRGIRLGMTKAEVESVMGRPDATWFLGTQEGFYFGRASALELRIFAWIGRPLEVRHDQWPVRVSFDNAGRVCLIGRGNEDEVLEP